MKIRKVKKLLPNIKDKKKYLVDIKKLSQVIKHGLKLIKVH